MSCRSRVYVMSTAAVARAILLLYFVSSSIVFIIINSELSRLDYVYTCVVTTGSIYCSDELMRSSKKVLNQRVQRNTPE